MLVPFLMHKSGAPYAIAARAMNARNVPKRSGEIRAAGNRIRKAFSEHFGDDLAAEMVARMTDRIFVHVREFEICPPTQSEQHAQVIVLRRVEDIPGSIIGRGSLRAKR
ncbi:hypothetical protein [Rhizobium sp. BG4]|uniref:hypothetical protein n=1 Tax=Rhizobium sp. BG4 TaxID=2613770 RepID=UPI00193EB934|nr:hypothetical protein [Rhizobium sp. BG4]QRM45357.1 hypothetical protein F2982_19065 [Rhizobium sp. BG4]